MLLHFSYVIFDHSRYKGLNEHNAKPRNAALHLPILK